MAIRTQIESTKKALHGRPGKKIQIEDDTDVPIKRRFDSKALRGHTR